MNGVNWTDCMAIHPCPLKIQTWKQEAELGAGPSCIDGKPGHQATVKTSNLWLWSLESRIYLYYMWWVGTGCWSSFSRKGWNRHKLFLFFCFFFYKPSSIPHVVINVQKSPKIWHQQLCFFFFLCPFKNRCHWNIYEPWF